MAHRDREVNRPRRVKIERSLQAAEELAGRHVWQSWHTDYRGRMYTGNKFVTTQGQDHEKAQLSFLPTNTNQDSEAAAHGCCWPLRHEPQELERTPHLGRKPPLSNDGRGR